MITLNDKDRLNSAIKTIEKVKSGTIDWNEYMEQASIDHAANNLTYLANKLQLIKAKALASEPMPQKKMARVSASRYVAGREELKQQEVLQQRFKLTTNSLIEDLTNIVSIVSSGEHHSIDWKNVKESPRYRSVSVRKLTDEEVAGYIAIINFKMTALEEHLGLVPETNGIQDDPLDIKFDCLFPSVTYTTAEEYEKLISEDIRWAKYFALEKYNAGETDKEQFIEELRECKEKWKTK